MSTSKTTFARRRRNSLLLGGAFVLGASVLSMAGCGAEGTGDDEEHIASPDQEALSSIQKHPHRSVCGSPIPGEARCHARIRTQADGDTVQAFAAPQGLTPANLQAAYGIPTTGTGTVAIVDAQDDPNAESDLATYRAQFGLPPCTTANGCFKKVNQKGQASPLPASDAGWAGEISLDLDMVSAACPKCKIILVEANSASMSDLGAAVNMAASLGANAISNSYGGPESSGITTFDTKFFNHPGILITASSGDEGFGTEYPASGAHVLAVGGTSLTKSSSARGWAEGAWNEGGSGCSAFVAKPTFQKDTGCAKRTVADVAAVADPNTGVAVFDSFGGAGGWTVFGGTSAAAPLVAAIFVATGHGSADNSFPYAHTGDFFDVTTGTNGKCSTTAKYLCTAGAGYDGPTGVGTPNAATFGSGSSSSSSSSGGTTSSSSSSSSSTSSTSSSSSSSSSSGGTSCSHAICKTGTKLTSTCDPCAKAICAADSFCCASSWDSICVGEVTSICGESCP